MIVALGAVIAAIWLLAIYGTIHEAQETKYDVSVRPGAVSYGTRSSVTVPMVSAPARHTAAPMISGSAVRSYAHYGHASMPSSATGSGFKMHTTSSATVHTIGSGGGGVSSPSGDRGASSRGITYGGGTVSLPSLALVTPVYSSSAEAETPARYGMGPRRARPSGKPSDDDYEEGTWVDGGDGDWWFADEDLEDWRQPEVGEERIDGILGYSVTWTGSGWVKSTEYEPGVPLTDAPASPPRPRLRHS